MTPCRQARTPVPWTRSLPATLLVAVLLAAAVAPLPAQMPATPQQGSVAPVSRSIGIHGGLNLADLVGGDAGDSESGVGLNAGASFQLLRLGPVSLGPEVFYAQKRPERVAALSGLSSPVASRFNLAYVEVPLLLRIHLPRFAGGRLAPHVHGGPVFGWNLDCDIDFADRDARPEDTCSSLLGGDARSTLEDYEQGVTVGAGMNVVVVPGRGALSLDLRTTRGLSDVIETSEGPDLEIRNRTFSALLGYSFGL